MLGAVEAGCCGAWTVASPRATKGLGASIHQILSERVTTWVSISDRHTVFSLVEAS